MSKRDERPRTDQSTPPSWKHIKRVRAHSRAQKIVPIPGVDEKGVPYIDLYSVPGDLAIRESTGKDT